MAQAEYTTQTARAAGAQTAGGLNLVTGLGALVSLALIVGLGVWGYKLAVRDVTGIPVVRAVEGPMRIQPENPGGDAAAHQGYSVNGVQADGTAADPADSLALAPRAVELQPEDLPATPNTQIAVPTGGTPQAIDVTATPTDDAREGAEDILALAGQTDGDGLALSDALESVEDTASDTQNAVAAAVAEAVSTPLDIIPASVPGVSQSPRPGRRPGDFAQTVAALRTEQATQAAQSDTAAPTAVSAPAVQEKDAATIPVGTRLVQLGAYESADVARTEWGKLALRFEEYLEGKIRVVEKASSGGKTFYRLRAMGFDDLADARRFCAVLMQGQAACIPVVTR